MTGTVCRHADQRHVRAGRVAGPGILDAVSDIDPWDPGSPRNRDRTRESQRQVRDLLLGWDPIGVAGTDSAEGEYDFMISPLLHVLHDGAGREAIALCISSQRDYMGLGPDDLGADRQLAADLVGWCQRRTSAG
jgi:hypothetical protein